MWTSCHFRCFYQSRLQKIFKWFEAVRHVNADRQSTVLVNVNFYDCYEQQRMQKKVILLNRKTFLISIVVHCRALKKSIKTSVPKGSSLNHLIAVRKHVCFFKWLKMVVINFFVNKVSCAHNVFTKWFRANIL